MRLRTTSAGTAAAVIAGVVGTLGLPAVTARADSAAVLPITQYSHLVVDGAHGHLFFSEGAGSDAILVTDLDGTDPTTITGEPGATGLALSADGGTLYAALADGDAVSAVDTASLTESARYPTGAGSHPSTLARTGDKLWYGYGTAGSGGVGELDPTAATPTAAPQTALGHWTSTPLLAAAAGVLVVAEPSQNLTHMASFDVSTDTVRPLADTLVGAAQPSDLQLTPNGSTVVVAPDGGAAHVYFNTADLSRGNPGVLYSGGVGAHQDSVAVAADGTVAAGSGNTGGADLFLYAPGRQQDMNRVDFAPDLLAPAGLAWSADGLGLYAVVRTASGGYGLRVLDSPRMTATQLTLAYPAPATAVPTLTYTVHGQLTALSSVPAGETVQVTRDGTALPDAVLGADGGFAISDTRQTEGRYAYQVSYPGDATHQPSTATLAVQVGRIPTDVLIGAITSATPGSVAFDGTLSDGPYGGPFAVGTVLRLTRINEDDQTEVDLPDVPVAADGSYTVTDAPQSAHRFTYRLSYAGDVTHAPSTADQSLEVARTDTVLTLTAPATAARGAALAVPGKLAGGPFPAGETVQVSRTDAASPQGTAPWNVPVAADGSFRITDTPQIGGTVGYRVGYPGDAAHNSSSGSATVQVSRATTALTVTSNAASYAYGATATVTAHLGSTYNGRTVSVYAQPKGGARTLLRTGAVDAKGNLTVAYRLTRGTTFSAVFAGDYRYAPATATRTVTDRAAVGTALSGYYTSIRSGSTVYRVYHHTARPGVAVTVTPAKPGQCVKLVLQEYDAKAWHTTLTVACARIDSAGRAAGNLTLENAVGHDFRIAADYLPSGSDLSSLATWGSWQYLTVRT